MNKKHHSKLWLRFTALVFATILAVFVFITLIWLLLYKLEIITANPGERRIPFLVLSFGSLLLGIVIALYVGKLIVRPMQNIGNAFNEVSKGNFNVKVSEDEKVAEIREMAKQFNSMAHDLSHIEALGNDFVANVSHEFKTPLASIEGYATLLQNPKLTKGKHDRYVQIILENSKKLSALSGNILLLSKLENRQILPDQTEYRLDEQIRRCILTLEPKWESKNIEFDLMLPTTLYYGSESLLEQVWVNILDNAVKHSPEYGKITVLLENSDKEISVSIKDSGEGMSKEVQKHIFEKFYQGDPSRKSEGNGLGLALVKKITELCGGNVTVKSEVGKGSEFIINLKNLH